MLYLKNDPLHTQPCVGGKGLFEKPNTKIVTLLLDSCVQFSGRAGWHFDSEDGRGEWPSRKNMRFSIGCVVKMWSMSAPETAFPVSVITHSSRLRAECIVLLAGGKWALILKAFSELKPEENAKYPHVLNDGVQGNNWETKWQFCAQK